MTNKHPLDIPHDRSSLKTEERNRNTTQLHTLSVKDCVKVIVQEDQAVFHAMQKAEKAISDFIEKAKPRFIAGGRLVYIGAGTSGRLGVLDASEIPPTFQADDNRIVAIIAGGDKSLRTSSEGKEDDPTGAYAELDSLALNKNDTLLGIAAGGTTPYVLGALNYVKKYKPNIYTGMLTCTSITKPVNVDHLILIETGPEVLTGSTRMKAGTATKLALNTISTTLMIHSGKVYENLMVDLRATNDKLRDRATRIVSDLTGLSRSESFCLITEADWSVKIAIVMHHGKLTIKEASHLLDACGNQLDSALTKLNA